MKILIVFLFIFISLSASAQVRTGGGTGPSGFYSNDEDYPTQQREMLNNFTARLIARDIICSGKGKGKRNLSFDSDFMQVYLKLSVVKNFSLVSSQCLKIKDDLRCLYDEPSVEMTKKIVQNLGMSSYLRETYKIDRKQAEEMLNFFRNFLDLPCPKSKVRCEM
jgi:hypothetical protein